MINRISLLEDSETYHPPQTNPPTLEQRPATETRFRSFISIDRKGRDHVSQVAMGHVEV